MKPQIIISDNGISVETGQFSIRVETNMQIGVDDLRTNGSQFVTVPELAKAIEGLKKDEFIRRDEIIGYLNGQGFIAGTVEERKEAQEQKTAEKITKTGRKTGTATKACEFCGKQFKAASNAQRFCSDECKQDSKNLQPDAALKETLEEIEKRKKESYKFSPKVK